VHPKRRFDFLKPTYKLNLYESIIIKELVHPENTTEKQTTQSGETEPELSTQQGQQEQSDVVLSDTAEPGHKKQPETQDVKISDLPPAEEEAKKTPPLEIFGNRKIV
jgi:hypothetical protein